MSENSSKSEPRKKRPFKKKTIFLIIAAAAVLFAGYRYFAGGGVSVTMETIKAGNFSDSFKESGVYSTGKATEVIASAGGKVTEVPVKLNEQVKQGDPIAVLDSTDYENQKISHENLAKSYLAEAGNAEKTEKTTKQDNVTNAESAMKSAETLYKAAKKDLSDSRALFNSGVISEKDYTDIKTKYDTEKLAYDTAKKDYDTARKRLDELNAPAGNSTETANSNYLMAESYRAQAESENKQVAILEKKIASCRITAPCDGIITDLPAEKVTSINEGDQVAVIKTTEGAGVECSILTTSAPYLKTGDQVNIVQKLKGGDMVYMGHITKINDYADKSTSALGLDEYRIKVKCEFETVPEGVKDGYSFDVEFFAYPLTANVISVPNSAVFKDGTDSFVFTVRGNRAEQTKIEAGHKGNARTEVLSGLSEGDRIIVNANVEGLEDGARVEKE